MALDAACKTCMRTASAQRPSARACVQKSRASRMSRFRTEATSACRARRVIRYLAIGKRCCGGRGTTWWSEWYASSLPLCTGASTALRALAARCAAAATARVRPPLQALKLIAARGSQSASHPDARGPVCSSARDRSGDCSPPSRAPARPAAFQ